MYEFWGWVWFSGELQECRNVFLVLTPNKYERWGLSVGVLIYVNNDDIISGLCRRVCCFLGPLPGLKNRYGD